MLTRNSLGENIMHIIAEKMFSNGSEGNTYCDALFSMQKIAGTPLYSRSLVALDSENYTPLARAYREIREIFYDSYLAAITDKL